MTAEETPAPFHDLVSRRLRNQRLVAARAQPPEAVVAALGAIQAQDYAGAKWAVAQRAGDRTDADVEDALGRGAILRTHVLRPTWHFVVPADIRWMLALTAPRVHALNAAYYRNAGLDGRLFARSNAALARALEDGHHLTRDEVRAVLRGAGIAADGLRFVLLTMRAELDAVVCSGPRRGKQPTYAALDERAPPVPTLPRDEALAELARRYFGSHGPARAQDFAWWSGLRVADAMAAIGMLGATLASERYGEQTYWYATVTATKVTRALRPNAARLHLLPAYDEYLVGARDHAPVVDARHAKALGVRGGLLGTPVVIWNGRVIGSWRRTLGRDHVAVEAKLLAALGDAERTALEQETVRYGCFLGLRARLQVRAPRPDPRSRPLPG